MRVANNTVCIADTQGGKHTSSRHKPWLDQMFQQAGHRTVSTMLEAVSNPMRGQLQVVSKERAGMQ